SRAPVAASNSGFTSWTAPVMGWPLKRRMVTVCPANGQCPGAQGFATAGGTRVPGVTTLTPVPERGPEAPCACAFTAVAATTHTIPTAQRAHRPIASMESLLVRAAVGPLIDQRGGTANRRNPRGGIRMTAYRVAPSR